MKSAYDGKNYIGKYLEYNNRGYSKTWYLKVVDIGSIESFYFTVKGIEICRDKYKYIKNATLRIDSTTTNIKIITEEQYNKNVEYAKKYYKDETGM